MLPELRAETICPVKSSNLSMANLPSPLELSLLTLDWGPGGHIRVSLCSLEYGEGVEDALFICYLNPGAAYSG